MIGKKGYHEDFTKFFENPTRERLREVIKKYHGELDNLDFKKEWIESSKLAKHILGFANSKRGCIIFGMEQKSDNSLEPVGLSDFKDPSSLKNGIRSFIPEKLIYELVPFNFEASEYNKIKGKKFQVLFVSDDPKHLPYIAMNNGESIRKNAIYIRDGTKTEEANYEKLQDIINRRIGTGYSSRSENQLEEDLAHLKALYNYIPKYYSSFPFVNLFNKPNPKYPNEDFEDFIIKMISLKKKIIESIIRGAE